MEKYSGRCRCEKITFKIRGEPTWKVNCNCNWCQTTSGSAFRSFVIFKEDDILEIDYFLLNTLRKKELSSNINFYIKSVAIQKQEIGC